MNAHIIQLRPHGCCISVEFVNIVFSGQAVCFTGMVVWRFLLVNVVSAQPIFPDGVATILNSLADRQAGIAQPSKDDARKLEILKAEAADGLKRDLIAESDHNELAKLAYEVVHVRLLKNKFLGGCPRNFDVCPTGWVNSSWICQPPSSYEGLCDALPLRDRALKFKEDFAWRCKADFPCQNPCVKDFASCPTQWNNLGGGLCVAAADYNGMCSPATDFSGYTVQKKASWATSCGATWCSYSSMITCGARLLCRPCAAVTVQGASQHPNDGAVS